MAKMNKKSSMKMMKKSPAKFGGNTNKEPDTSGLTADNLGQNKGESIIDKPKKPTKKKGTTSYREAYKKVQEKAVQTGKNKYKTFEEFKKAAEDYNNKKYGTTEPTREAKVRTGGSKKKLAEVKKKSDAVKISNKKKTDANNVRVQAEIKKKSDKIKAERTGEPKTKKRTKVGKVATKIANKFRKNKKDPNRTATKVEKNKTKLANKKEKLQNKEDKKANKAKDKAARKTKRAVKRGAKRGAKAADKFIKKFNKENA